jgi:NADP-dependent aldehyde dehydrogenase
VPGTGVGWSVDATVLRAPMIALQPGSRLLEECFGPVVVVVEYAEVGELDSALATLQGSLAASVITGGDDDPDAGRIVSRLAGSVGRVTVDDWPTGVAYSWAQQHGGPWPATSNPAATSVGAAALNRFVRPITFQSVPDAWLPAEAQAANPWGVPRRVDGVVTHPARQR